MSRGPFLLRSGRRARLAAALTGVMVIGSAGAVYGQVSARGPAMTGLAGGGSAYVYGTEAIFRNPANLAIDHSRGIELSLGRMAAAAGGDLLQFNHYNELFTQGRSLDNADAQSVVDAWFGGPGSQALRRVSVSVEAVPLALVHGLGRYRLGYGVRLRTMSTAGINGGWLDLLLSGTGQDRTIPLNGEFAIMAATEVSLGIATTFEDDRLAVGVAPKLVLGNEFVDSRLRSTAVVSAESIVHDFDYSVRAAGGLSRDVIDGIDFFSSDVFGGTAFRPRLLSTAGVGMGVDLGATFRMTPGLLLSASITDAGFVRWSDGAQTIEPFEQQFTFEGLLLDIDRVRDEYGGDLGDYFLSTIDSLASGTYDQVNRRYAPFTTGLPTAVHFGAAWRAPGGRLRVVGGTSASVTSSVVRVASTPEVHVGAEYAPGGAVRVPLRAGLFVGGASALTIGFGFGVHTPHYDFDIGFAASPLTHVAGAGGRYAGGVSALTIRF